MNAAVEAVVGEVSAKSASIPLGSPVLRRLDQAIAECVAGLKKLQKPDGHWVFELEADATIPSEYVLLHHFLGEVDPAIEQKIGVYLRQAQGEHGGWPLFHSGEFDMSATVKAYYALKIIGDDIDAPHMKRARDAILERGGAAACNVFTRIMLALYRQVPWRAIPVMPVEIFHLPRWFPFHLSKVSYWSRTVIAPLLILMALKPAAVNPRKVDIRELFLVPPDEVGTYLRNPTGSRWGDILLWIDSTLRLAEPFFPRAPRRKAIDKAMSFVTERLNGEHGLGAIYRAIPSYAPVSIRSSPRRCVQRFGRCIGICNATRPWRRISFWPAIIWCRSMAPDSLPPVRSAVRSAAPRPPGARPAITISYWRR
jgi:squalene-hopene/tetraprenyl-beta-curcumene cyclase